MEVAFSKNKCLVVEILPIVYLGQHVNLELK